MDTFHIILVAVIVGALIYSYFFSKTAIIKRRLKKARLVNVANFKEGQRAKLIGRAESVNGDMLIAPLSGRECCYYHVTIEQEVSSGKSTSWKTVIEEEQWVEYIINDNGYYAYLNADDIKSHIVRDREYRSGFLNDATPHLEAFLRKHGHDSEGWLGFNKTLRYNEAIIEPGETLAVLGRGNWTSAEALGLPEKYGKVLSVTYDDKKAIYMSDESSLVAKG